MTWKERRQREYEESIRVRLSIPSAKFSEDLEGHLSEKDLRLPYAMRQILKMQNKQMQELGELREQETLTREYLIEMEARLIRVWLAMRKCFQWAIGIVVAAFLGAMGAWIWSRLI